MKWIAFVFDASINDVRDALKRKPQQELFPVVGTDRRYLGYIKRSDIEKHAGDASSAGDIRSRVVGAGEPRNAYVYDNDSLDRAERLMESGELQLVPVVGHGHVFIGTVDREAAARR